MHLVRQPKSLFKTETLFSSDESVDEVKFDKDDKVKNMTTELEKHDEETNNGKENELDSKHDSSSSDEERGSESQDSSNQDSVSDDDEEDSNETKETEDMEESEEKDVRLEGEEDEKSSPVSQPVSPSHEEENILVIDTKDLDSSKWDVDTIMSKFTSKELKEMCKMRSLSLNGSKRDLAVRVVEHKNNQ